MTYTPEYYQQNKELIDGYNKAWQLANPEKFAESRRKWRAANEGHTYEQPTGYVTHIGFEHPISNPSGVTPYHRIVLWDKLSGNDAPCNWCGKQLYWSKSYRDSPTDALIVDHLNEVKNDNRPENLVPSCGPCNTKRSPRPKVHTGKCAVEFCDRDAAIAGVAGEAMCKTHYTQVWAGKEPQPIRAWKRGGSGLRDENGRECSLCGEYKPWSNYHKRKSGVHISRCNKCNTAKTAEYKAKRLAEKIPCIVEDCDQFGVTLQMCQRHYSVAYYAARKEVTA